MDHSIYDKSNHNTHNHQAHDPGVTDLKGHVYGLHAPIDFEIEPFLELNGPGRSQDQKQPKADAG